MIKNNSKNNTNNTIITIKKL